MKAAIAISTTTMIIAMIMATAPAAFGQEGGELTLDPGTYFAMDNATAESYIRDYLGVEQNSTTAALVRENQVMNEETVNWIKEFIISTIRNNLTSMVVTIDEYGYMAISSEAPEDGIRDDIEIVIDDVPFDITENYQFQLGKIIAPNGTQVLPRQ